MPPKFVAAHDMLEEMDSEEVGNNYLFLGALTDENSK